MTTLSLFPEDNVEPELPPGLIYVPNFITDDEEQELLEMIDGHEWLDDLLRRVQHYGYKYNYKARKIDNSMYLGPLPEWVETISTKIFTHLQTNEVISDESTDPLRPFDQAIINEYEPGQGISAHVDCVPCFGPVIATLSLGSDTQMQFDEPQTGVTLPVPLAQRSLAILTGPSRYRWQHSISSRKSDRWPIENGPKILRSRRVSATFRSILKTL